MEADTLRYLIHHIVLPPKLPQEDDWSVSNELALVNHTSRAFGDFRKTLAVEHAEAAQHIASVVDTIENLIHCSSNGCISETGLADSLRRLAAGQLSGTIPLRVNEQNAGIIISRSDTDILFEVFELSPPNAMVMSTQGRLIRTFPTYGSKIPATKFQEDGLVESLAHTIAEMCAHHVPEFQPKVTKGGKEHSEIRDTTHPALVTEYLINVLSAIGKPVVISGITKNTREDVLWSETLHPWRRSPLWLLVRVAIQIQLSRYSGTSLPASDLFKAGMVHVVATLLDAALAHHGSVDMDLLYTISIKLDRRLRKLKASQTELAYSLCAKSPLLSLSNANHFMKNNWKRMARNQEQNIDMDGIATLQVEDDVDLSIPKLDQFICQINARSHQPATSKFLPDFSFPKFSATELPALSDTSKEASFFQLAAIEKWVQDFLSSWVDQHIELEPAQLRLLSSCERLGNLLRAYHERARVTYANVPRNLSVMYLTIMELWVACDKCACHCHKLLLDYNPEVDVASLCYLSLPFKSQMKRLVEIERYVGSRRKGSMSNAPSLFRNFGHTKSFSVRYYDDSLEHQSLKEAIEQEAQSQREQKRAELAEKKEKYRKLMTESGQLEHTYVNKRDRWGDFHQAHHPGNCRKCSLAKEARNISILTHEWPLPSSLTEAKAAIFELQIPHWFSRWRDTTRYLMISVLKFTKDIKREGQPRYKLEDQDCLRSRQRIAPRQCLVTVSKVKPLNRSHYKTKGSINHIENDDVCVPNAMHCAYYDTISESFPGVLRPTDHVRENCSYQLPARSKNLERYLLAGPGVDEVSPNSVISSLSDCPHHIAQSEYKAFGALPIGHHIQYLNILTQLAMPTVDFAKVETQCLILQTIHQAGPPLDDYGIERIAHHILTDGKFCEAILNELEALTPTIAKNWESWRGLAAMVQLALRMFELTPAESVQDRCLAWLADAREVALDWLNNLKSKFRSSIDHTQRLDLMSRATEVALLCTSTFDVDEVHLNRILSLPREASVLIQGSIVIQENQDHVTSEHNHLLRAMMQDWKSLHFRILPVLRDGILHRNLQAGLNEAMKLSWSGFEPGLWTPFDDAYPQWICLGCSEGKIHFNLLTAQLLVNGIPLARLPQDYTSNPMYLKLFQQSIIEIMPPKEPGMCFTSKFDHHGYALNFGMSHNNQMLVVAIQDKKKYDLVPLDVFEGVLPSAFATDYFHWYDHSKDVVEFRPRQKPWDSSTKLWHLKKVQCLWQLVKGSSSLVNPVSKTGRMLSAIFSPLENKPHIHITFLGPSTTHISLPRLQLDFRFDLGQSTIYSSQYRGMVIDSNQQIGTLVGLNNKLVLKHNSGVVNRMVLIPEGLVSFGRFSDHVRVSIDANTATKAHSYQIDATLGRIEDNGSLQSKLFLCYLHCLTSYFLPDDLTSHTGTEAALRILRSAAVASFDVLTQHNINYLKLIAKLTPKRTYYPDHLRVMQQVFWNNHLSFSSQHPELHLEVEKIFTICRDGQSLRPKDVFVEPPTMRLGNAKLLERHMISSSIFRADGFGGEHFTRNFDVVYEGREDHSPNKGQLSFITSTMVLREEPSLHSKIDTEKLQESLRDHYLKNSEVLGPDKTIKPTTLKYSAKWLSEQSTWLPKLLCRLHASLPIEGKFNKYNITMWLSSAAFAKTADMNVIQALVSFYKIHPAISVAIPKIEKYDLSKGDSPIRDVLYNCVTTYKRPFDGSPESMLSQRDRESNRQYFQRRMREFEFNQLRVINSFVSALLNQWPCEQPSNPITEGAETYIYTSGAMESANTEFKFWYDNRCFYQYLKSTVQTLPQDRIKPIANQPNVAVKPQQVNGASLEVRSYLISSIFALPPDREWPVSPTEPSVLTEESTHSENNQSKERLAALCQQLDRQAKSSQEKQYVLDLRRSCDSLSQNETQVNFQPDLVATLQSYASDCQKYFTTVNNLLEDLVNSNNDMDHIRQRPRVCPIFWLQRLNKKHFDQLSAAWKLAIVQYGLAVTQLQRARRLLALADHPKELAEELRNRGHQNWNPVEFPETLLLEAESGILVRPVQESIARQMRQPPNAENAVMQLNMGEGKSTVIVPMIAAALGNDHTLVRVVVAKPQSKQMLEMLVSKLGGLLNRRIYHMPFSRASRLSPADADALGKIYRDCMEHRGVLLVQPEQVLSLQLMCIESLITGNEALGRALLKIQQFFDTHSRDIVDESDENFSVRFELVYTMGAQKPIELSPERWNLVHSLLSLIPQYAKQVKALLPSSIEVDDRWAGRYPRIRILRDDAEDELLDLIATRICKLGSPVLAITRLSKTEQNAILRYIRYTNLSPDDIEKVENGKSWAVMKDTLLLLRGLIAGGVLRFVLRFKRWRVNYGLDFSRETKLAVPYRSKDSPSPRSEFSHPEVIIMLTSLTYYYGGLTDQELFDTFSHLSKSDQKDDEYREWVRGLEIPKAFHLLSGINIKDRQQCITEIFPLLRFSKGAIDYFLSHTVFLKEMKEFPEKLSASGWDLAAVKPKPNPTTGFSGTNDSRHVLPLTMRHLDLQEQEHTNALVLGYLLQDENSLILLPPSASKTSTSTAETLLDIVNQMDANTRVILDVGAQILELNNLEVAEAWLSKSNPETSQAVVFFDDEELSVIDRSGRVEPLQTSAFSKHLESCLIYLDESHTRGTNLKLPKNYRAAVTLGANLTKDRLVQACMRLRKLGKGQSVVFCISEEIQDKIIERTSKSADEIEVSDVLMWAITETWSDLRRSIPLWATQGQRYEKHKHLLGTQTTADQAKQFLEEEAQTVEHRYRPRVNNNNEAFKGWDISNPNVKRIIQRCQDFNAFNFDAASLQEEQERELAPEIEEERQLERPPMMSPEKHEIHEHLIYLVKTGKLIAKSFVPAFEALQETSPAEYFDVKTLPSDLLVTQDFIKTLTYPKGLSTPFKFDSFLRPVQWILSFPKEKVNGSSTSQQHQLMVLSPYEADQLLRSIRSSSHVTLHLYAPRTNQVFRPLDNLDLFQIGNGDFDIGAVDRSLIMQLNLFAGQLYFRSYGEYTEMCDYLGLAWATAKEGQEVETDGFIRGLQGKWGLEDSPVRFFRGLMKLRREGEGIDKTQVGKLLNGVMLTEDDFLGE
ncbi:hypothetical protein DM02DRAFT_676940 [Periconia macrospinosa]|uniref:ubiquitinyl hydrolase 1 n=1 Tax=Periconia macrospinosa TaxID=97972 RepID=A0A2V1D5F8_9PLEO|nr:hypothetical protein DM02DRAFT_676940 [Periconia macrospinosa]